MKKICVGILLGASFLAEIASAGERLLAGSTLYGGGMITSPAGRYSLIMQTDGSLVIYRSDGSIRYSMEKYGTYAVMQADGNFVEYRGGSPSAGGGTAIWSTNTWGKCDDCWLEIYDNGDLQVGWHNSSYSYGFVAWSIGVDTDAPARWDAARYPMSEAIPQSSAPGYFPADEGNGHSIVINY